MNDLKKADSSKIDFKTVKVGDGDSAKEIKEAKLKSHGIIAKDKDGKFLTKVDGHTFGKAKVEEVVKQLLAEKK
ncbi:MAG: hypothetical protein ACI8T1_004187 [Verrucomicrobiales bacterium]